ncbi:hypothetical protein [Phenylobacterium sp.]|uniref:hypothetical protein n=1 Tax=Phenylobacterium sp. TaxID=1871053 RepID=UPI002ED8DE6D
MSRALATSLALTAVFATGPVAAATKGSAPKPRPTPTVAAVLARAGVADETTELRHLIGDAAAPAADHAAQRAAIRACHAERYATARDNVLTGRATPLRSC